MALECQITSTEPIDQTTYEVYPQPATDLIRIIGPAPDKVEITNPQGQLVSTWFNTDEIEIDELPPGMYFITIEKKEHSVIQRIIKR